MKTAKQIMALYASDDCPGRAWSESTQLELCLSFIDSGKSGLVEFVRYLNEVVAEERTAGSLLDIELEGEEDYPMMPDEVTG